MIQVRPVRERMVPPMTQVRPVRERMVLQMRQSFVDERMMMTLALERNNLRQSWSECKSYYLFQSESQARALSISQVAND